MPDVAITGGSGFVGGDLLDALVERGDDVRAIVRSRTAAEIVQARGASPVVVDLFDADALRSSLWGVPVLFHVAGVNDTCPRNTGEMDRVNVDGARAVVEAAADAGVGRIVLTSSAATIGEAPGTIGAEHTAHTGEYLSAYARSKHHGELAAFSAAEELGIDLVAVNPSSVQGPGRAGGSAKLLLRAISSDRPWLYDTHLSIVDVADCTHGHLAAAERGRPGERYLLSGATVRVSDAVSSISDAIGTHLDPRWVSEGVLRTLGRPAARMASWIRPGAGICPALVDTLLHGHRFDASKSEQDLGLVYRSLEDTLARTIAWFRSEGLID